MKLCCSVSIKIWMLTVPYCRFLLQYYLSERIRVITA